MWWSTLCLDRSRPRTCCWSCRSVGRDRCHLWTISRHVGIPQLGGRQRGGFRTASVLTDGIFEGLVGAQGGVVDGIPLVVAERCTDALVPWPAARVMPICGSTASTHCNVHFPDDLVTPFVIALNHCECRSPRVTRSEVWRRRGEQGAQSDGSRTAVQSSGERFPQSHLVALQDLASPPVLRSIHDL